jgi:F0F1-type ATP synthase membrane subunit c/vacuolar-type H+-ATPase subunit K
MFSGGTISPMADDALSRQVVPFVGGIACAFLFVVLHTVIYNRLEAESFDLLVGGTLIPLFSALSIGLLGGYYTGRVVRKNSLSKSFLSGLFLAVLVEYLAFALTMPRGRNLAALSVLAFIVFSTVSVSGLTSEFSLIGMMVVVFVFLSAVWVLVLAAVYYVFPIIDVFQDWRPWVRSAEAGFYLSAGRTGD